MELRPRTKNVGDHVHKYLESLWSFIENYLGITENRGRWYQLHTAKGIRWSLLWMLEEPQHRTNLPAYWWRCLGWTRCFSQLYLIIGKCLFSLLQYFIYAENLRCAWKIFFLENANENCTQGLVKKFKWRWLLQIRLYFLRLWAGQVS